MIKNLEPVGNYMLVLFIGIAIGTIFPDFQRDKRKGAHNFDVYNTRSDYRGNFGRYIRYAILIHIEVI